MNLRQTKFRVVGLTILAASLSLAVEGQTICSPLSQSEAKRLEAFLKAQDPKILEVRPEPISVATGACYHQITIRKSGESGKETLLLSPDHRYVSKQVIDTRPELGEKEQMKLKAMTTMLSNESKRPSLGAPEAPVAIDVFSDFECPYCRKEFNMLDKEYFPQHKSALRITFHQNPLPYHPWAQRATEMTECAYEQNNKLFWIAHDFLFENQNSFTPTNIEVKVIEALSKETGFLAGKFQSCLSRQKVNPASGIEADRKLALALDVSSTPTIFINGLKIEGTPRIEQLDTLVKEFTKGASVSIAPATR